MEVASTVVQHISNRKSELSIAMETDEKVVEPDAPLPFPWRAWYIPRVSTLLYMVLLVYWILTEQNGFSVSIPSMIYPSTDVTAYGYLGYHAVGLSVWAVIANQETIMAFAIPFYVHATYATRKLVHIIVQIVGLLCGIGGMVAIIWYKSSSVSMSVNGTYITIPIMKDEFYIPYSPHAWLGIAFIGSWMIQCIGRLYPERFTLEYHRFFGRILYTTGLACCCLGIQQQQTRQLVTTITSVLSNSTGATTATVATRWWFSQPSLAVMLLGITGAATFFYGLL